MSLGSRQVLLVLTALAVIFMQPVAAAQAAPTPLCFCESAASKPANNGAFVWLDGLPLLVIAVAAVLVSLMVFLLLRLMKEDSGTADSGTAGQEVGTPVEVNAGVAVSALTSSLYARP